MLTVNQESTLALLMFYVHIYYNQNRNCYNIHTNKLSWHVFYVYTYGIVNVIESLQCYAVSST